MVSLKLQKRLAADILGCGKGRVWIDPNEINEVHMANSRANVRKLIKDGIIIRKPIQIRSRYRWRKLQEAKRKGRHSGIGKRRGTAEARCPSKRQWIRRIRILRRLLRKYRNSGKINKHLYHELYMKVKGNVFKSKKNLMEHIFKAKAEQSREKHLQEQLEAKKQKQKAAREKAEKKEAEAVVPKTEPKKPEPKKTETKKPETKKPEAKKPEPKKTETKKPEPKKEAKKPAEKKEKKSAEKPAKKAKKEGKK